jgi:hypothetical protein
MEAAMDLLDFASLPHKYAASVTAFPSFIFEHVWRWHYLVSLALTVNSSDPCLGHFAGWKGLRRRGNMDGGLRAKWAVVSTDELLGPWSKHIDAG